MNARQRHIPAQPKPEPRPALLTLDQIAQHLHVHACQVLRLHAAGMPAVDLSAVRSPGRRRKRLLRFDASAVEAWLAQRNAPAGGSR